MTPNLENISLIYKEVDADVDVDVDELKRKVDEIEKKLGEGSLKDSSATGLITTQDHPVDLG